jgi:hypothetical protein
MGLIMASRIAPYGRNRESYRRMSLWLYVNLWSDPGRPRSKDKDTTKTNEVVEGTITGWADSWSE